MPEGQYAPYRDVLLEVAAGAIAHGVRHGRPPELDPEDYPQPLREPRACFVTLEINGQLRGCIGSLEAYRPLVTDVANNAFAAAFADPRFPPVSEGERALLAIHLSILNPAEPITFTSEEDLIGQLRPGVDGLILQAGTMRSTFLPTVWESLPDPRQFLEHLKYKAGLAPDYWSDQVQIWRYTTESLSADPH